MHAIYVYMFKVHFHRDSVADAVYLLACQFLFKHINNMMFSAFELDFFLLAGLVVPTKYLY